MHILYLFLVRTFRTAACTARRPPLFTARWPNTQSVARFVYRLPPFPLLSSDTSWPGRKLRPNGFYADLLIIV